MWNNKTRHYLVTNTATGEEYTDKCRNQPMGFINLVDRARAKFGDLTSIGDRTYRVDADGTIITINPITVR